MLEISEKDWERVLDIIKDKKAEIATLKQEKETLEEELVEAKTLFNATALKEENEKLTAENKKLNKALVRTNAALSLFAESLDEAFNVLEAHGLASRKSKILSREIDSLAAG